MEVVIASAVRTAIGKFGGALAATPPTQMASEVAQAAMKRAGVQARSVNEAYFGNVIHTEPKDMYLARVTALQAGMSDEAPALTLNRLCGSGLQAVVSGAEAITLGNAQVVLAGGAESMSRSGHLVSSVRFGQKMGDTVSQDMMTGALHDPFGHGHMGVTAENIAAKNTIERDRQDQVALRSHQRAAAAIKSGRFRSQILAVEVKRGRDRVMFDEDEHVRAEVTLEELASLPAAFQKGGSVTAGNSSGINDGASALVLTSAKFAESDDLQPLAIIRATGLGGVAPEVMGLGPIPATQQALARAGLGIDDLAVIESNEAFAAQCAAVADQLEFPEQITNPNGGAIALGHPVGASGAIILTKLVHELRRINGRYGLATMCIGGGQGIAVVIENPEAS